MLAWAAAGFLAGVLAGVPIPIFVAVASALALCLAAVRVDRRGARLALLFLATLVLGSARASHAGTSLGTLQRLSGQTVELTGVVAEEPDIRDSGANYLVSVSGVVTGRRVRPVTGRVQIHTSRAVVLDYGDRVLVTGTLRAPRNDKTLPYRDVLARRGIGSTMAYPRMLNEGPVDSGPAGWIVRLRQGLERNINAWLPEPEAALLIAIAIGSRSAALGNATGPLIATGLIHIIAISGIKVAMVAGTAYALLRRIPNRAVTLVAALALLAVYVALTGDTVSGERSAIMWALVFIAAYLGRGTLSWQSLGMVAAAMVAVQPGSLWDPAFQLTALGTGSIIAFTQPLLRTFRLVPSPFKEAFCVTLAAQVGTTPVVIGSFHVLAVWGPIANTAVLPLLPLLIVLGFALGALATVPALAVLVAGLAYALLRVVMLVATGLAVLPGTLPLSGVSAPLAFAYYALLTALSLAILRRANWAPPGRKPGNVTDVAFGFTLGAVVLTGTLLPSSALTTRLEWLGTGQALLLQSGGRVVLIDGSPRPFLLSEALGGRLGLRRHIDVIVVTDPRSNVAGLLDVLDHYSVGEVLDVGCEYPSTTYARWRAALRTRHIPVYALRTGVALTAGSASLTTVGPDAVYPQPRDSIGLLRVRVPGRTIFLAGAASQREMTEAVFRTVRLQADILVLDAGTAPPASFLRHVGASRIVRPSIADHLSHAATTVFESH